MRIPLAELGARAVECQLDVIDGRRVVSRVVRTAPEFVTRASTARPQA